jgi:hypothetical protein
MKQVREKKGRWKSSIRINIDSIMHF